MESKVILTCSPMDCRIHSEFQTTDVNLELIASSTEQQLNKPGLQKLSTLAAECEI